MNDENSSTTEQKKVAILDFEEKIKKYSVENSLTESDQKLLDTAKFWRTELYGNGVSGKTFGNYSALELSNILGIFSNLSFSIAELELKLKTQVKKQETRNELKKVELDEFFRTDYERQFKKRPTEARVKNYVTKKMAPYTYTLIFKEELFLSVQNLKWAFKGDIQAMDLRTKVKLSEKGVGSSYLDNTVELPEDFDLSLVPPKNHE